MSEKGFDLLEYEQTGRFKMSQFVTVHAGSEFFGFPVLAVRDVVKTLPITKIPLAPKTVAGAMNLRGRIVTAIDLKERLGIRAESDSRFPAYNVVVEHKGELYSIMVDSIGDVLSLSDEGFEKNPSNLESGIKSSSLGIYKLKDRLMVVLDVSRIIEGGELE